MFRVKYLLKLCNVIRDEANKILSDDTSSFRIVEIFMRLSSDDENIELVAIREDGIEIQMIKAGNFDSMYSYVTRNVMKLINGIVDKSRQTI